MARTTEQVFEDHLECRSRGALEDDLARNDAEDVIMLGENGARRGFDGVRRSAARLREQFPGQPYKYIAKIVEGEFAFLKWCAEAGEDRTIGADSFVIQNGKIVMQSVYY